MKVRNTLVRSKVPKNAILWLRITPQGPDRAFFTFFHIFHIFWPKYKVNLVMKGRKWMNVDWICLFQMQTLLLLHSRLPRSNYGTQIEHKRHILRFFPGISGVPVENWCKHCSLRWGIILWTLPKQFEHTKQCSWLQSLRGAYSCTAFDFVPPPLSFYPAQLKYTVELHLSACQGTGQNYALWWSRLITIIEITTKICPSVSPYILPPPCSPST